ncbi:MULTISPECIES: carbohydrate ABC transporter permease [Marinomonas]|uniref:Carbohydrate ABC transporter membrane protein 1 (CUT1 family) n=1 Tax=Marinomonas alcarazii TaxID=491949 RepID=A0A318UQW5_9GAMM|nr:MULTISPECIES: sugar ABC transporter permease [Marinomonas]PYF78916.1 carbohydrate ABC transporter membrane protein 1 (CUT1 family) [Marinomonas alcarazii]
MNTKAANTGSGPTQSGRPARLSLADWMPKIVMAPTVIVTLVCIYGYMIWTAVLSFTGSRMLPSYNFVGFDQYERLFNNDRWMVALSNLGIFGGLFIAICLFLGVTLAIFLDQKIRAEGAIRTIYLYPMAISFIVTGTAWKWLLNPTNGLEKMMVDFGFENFKFDWLINPDMVVYCLVIAAVWQASGFVMALFLAGLRGVDGDLIKAAHLDGASTFTTYRRIILPSLKPVFFSALVVLSHIAIKSFDLVAALTNGGPGYASDLPANFMYTYTFTRSQIGLGSASAMVMLGCVLAILVPYLYSELRGKRHE